jgi:hypothetical protein
LKLLFATDYRSIPQVVLKETAILETYFFKKPEGHCKSILLNWLCWSPFLVLTLMNIAMYDMSIMKGDIERIVL